jgi:hypothetical protein
MTSRSECLSPALAYDTITHSKPITEFVIKQVISERVMVGDDDCFGYDRLRAVS